MSFWKRPDRLKGPVTVKVQDHIHHLDISMGKIRYLRMGSGPPVLLLHTLRTQLEYFLPLIQTLDLDAIDVIVPDLPGHGRSAAPRAAYSAAYFVQAMDEFTQALGVSGLLVLGESIGAVIGLVLAGRTKARVAHVVALNPYDYGARGGIRRSSGLANVLFSVMLWPVAGSVVARAGTKGVLRRVLAGGLFDATALSAEFVDGLHMAGGLPGHARAFRSLCLHWRTWIDARAAYDNVAVPVTLAYGEHDWSRPSERAANASVLGVTAHTLRHCGHFSSLDQPRAIATLLREAL